MGNDIKTGHITISTIGNNDKKSLEVQKMIATEIAEITVPLYITEIIVWFEKGHGGRYYVIIKFPSEIVYNIHVLKKEGIMGVLSQVVNPHNHSTLNENHTILDLNKLVLNESTESIQNMESVSRSGTIVHNPAEFHMFPFEGTHFYNKIKDNDVTFHRKDSKWFIAVVESIGASDEWELPDVLNEIFDCLHDGRYKEGKEAIQNSFKSLMNISDD